MYGERDSLKGKKTFTLVAIGRSDVTAKGIEKVNAGIFNSNWLEKNKIVKRLKIC